MTSVKVKFDHRKVYQRDNKKLSKAQKMLMNEVVKDTTPYVPFQEGNLKNSAIRNLRRFKDKIVWDGPYARFLYEGFMMVGIKSRSAWARKGEIKEVIKGKALSYGKKNPMSCAKWFIVAKSSKCQKWVKFAKGAFKNG